MMRWFNKRPSRRETIEIAAHSIAEEHIFIDTMRCHRCGEEQMRREMHNFPCTWIAKCMACNQMCEIVSTTSLIMTDEYLQALNSGDGRRIKRFQRRYNHTDEPSNIIELTQWLELTTLFRSQMDELAERGGRASASYVVAEFQLVQCLQEALKFYKEDQDDPPREAFFSEESYAHYQADTDPFSQKVLRSILSQQRTPEDIEEDLERIEGLPEQTW